ncbi:autotransporter outer membrane beta-barrel domain-containing protein [Ferrovibrio sp.]|uniref:autotransporter outer membrane beta-barrel domain-containing protein n=1 Tax=Ferrovibrio sp. TaxID=1917215 RepID=UPI003D2D7F28
MLKKLAFTLLLGAAFFAPQVASAQSYNAPGSAAQAQQQSTVVISTSNASILASNIGSSLGSSLGSGFSGFGGGGFTGGTVTGGGAGNQPRGANLAPTSNTGVAMNSRESGRAAGAADKRFGAWLQGDYTSLEYNRTVLAFDGTAYSILGGLDYSVTDRFLVGLSLGYESADITTTYNAGTLKGTGVGVTPFFGFALNNTWSLSGYANYTALEYDMTRTGNTVRGSYDATRWFVGGGLDGNYAVGRFRLMPTVGVLYLEEKSDAYRESTGANVAGSTTKLGRLSFGGSVGYAFDNLMPYVKLVGEYDFEHPDEVSIGNGQFTQVETFGGSAALGVRFFGAGGISGHVEGGYKSLGREDLNVWNIGGRVRMAF